MILSRGVRWRFRIYGFTENYMFVRERDGILVLLDLT
jgi:hypothetical protein